MLWFKFSMTRLFDSGDTVTVLCPNLMIYSITGNPPSFSGGSQLKMISSQLACAVTSRGLLGGPGILV